MTETIRPFKIAIADDVLADLNQRLANTRWPEKEPVDDWSQGTPLSYIQSLCKYWQEQYNWREREALLNQFDQFITTIDNVDIHFIHARSPHENAVPLLMTHGWPGSVVEFQKVIKPLTDPTAFGGDAADAFHVICPSMPGYGFSGKPTTTGWGIEKIAEVWNQLMVRLGYEHYFAQGGDWGSAVTSAIGEQNLGNCKGIHINLVFAEPTPESMDNLTPMEQSALVGFQYYEEQDSGYSKQQSTRPQTIGYALTDSPAGEAAWIVEKFWSWTDADGDPLNVLTQDELLDNIMLYWCTETAASSARLYWESFTSFARSDVQVPTGCSIFPEEIFRCSQRWAEKTYKNIIYWNEPEKGGHFAAFEQPEIFADEVRRCFRSLR